MTLRHSTCLFSRMEVFVLVLLAALLFADRALAIMCFKCEKQPSNFRCLIIAFCAKEAQYCVSEKISATDGSKPIQISKFCADSCPSTGYTSGTVTMTTRCCQSFLCNTYSNDGGLQASSLVLGLSLLFSLLYTLLR